MKKIYHPYTLWEDYKAGLYDLEKDYDEVSVEEMCVYVRELLCNETKFYKVGLRIIKEWKYSSEVNLSNKSRNRQAWIGQASCCYLYGIPERITKIGWNTLNFDEQKKANAVADKIIKKWEVSNAKKI